MKYKLICGKHYDHYGPNLEHLVQSHLNEGWQLIGGVAYCQRTEQLFQAMVLYGEESESDGRSRL